MPNEDAEKLKLNLAADLKWFISAGYVIEFNDGSLDLPRVKSPNEPKKIRPSETIPAMAPVRRRKHRRWNRALQQQQALKSRPLFSAQRKRRSY